MPAPFDPANLLPGDVLLYHGTSWLSDLIRLFDGTIYSHASIFDGSNIMEALEDGIEVHPPSVSFAGVPYIDVFRFIKNGQSLGSASYPLAPLLARIQYYELNRQRYAYEDLLLLAVLCSTRNIPVISWIPGLSLIIRSILDNAADILAKIAAEGQQPVICSALVYRCYSEADPPGTYELQIQGADTLAPQLAAIGMSAQAVGQPPAIDPLVAEKRLFLQRWAALRGTTAHTPPSLSAFTSMATSSMIQAVADFVTPGDLSKSPNLTIVERITPS